MGERRAARLYHEGADGCTAESGKDDEGYLHVHRGTCPQNKDPIIIVTGRDAIILRDGNGGAWSYTPESE